MIVILLLLIFTLFIFYGGFEPDPKQGNYPGTEELIEDYDQYIGEKTDVTGRIVNTGPIRIEIEHGEKEKTLTITDIKEEVEKGDRLSVFGTVRQDNTIEAQNSFSVPFINYAYMYGISLVGATWIFVRIVKQWRWNGEEWWFERRDETLSLKQILKRGEGDG